MSNTKLHVVVGAQYGSEAKGHITAQIVKGTATVGRVVNVRVAGPNAGHSVVDEAGNKIALRQIPVGAAVSDDVILYIAPGSELDLGVVVSEINALRELGHKVSNLHISGEVTMLESHHILEEQKNELSRKLGSTAKGIGAARADRIWRGALRLFDDHHAMNELQDLGVTIADNLQFWAIQEQHEGLVSVVIEGTQGYGLGLHAGRYPFCTSSDTRAVDFLAMSGYPHVFDADLDIVLVARMFPIRVAGNSGHMDKETSWEELGLPEEKTTVTQKTRRVGEWDLDLVHEAVRAHGGCVKPEITDMLLGGRIRYTYVALTMVDQKWPLLEGLSGTKEQVDANILGTEGVDPELRAQWLDLLKFLEELEESGIFVPVVGTSPSTVITRMS